MGVPLIGERDVYFRIVFPRFYSTFLKFETIFIRGLLRSSMEILKEETHLRWHPSLAAMTSIAQSQPIYISDSKNLWHFVFIAANALGVSFSVSHLQPSAAKFYISAS